MGDVRQHEPSDMGQPVAEATASLAEIRRHQGQVVKAVLVPGWYWWPMAAAIIAIGVARDSGDVVVQAITIPLAALCMVVLTGAMIPAVRRRVQIHATMRPGARGGAAIIGLIVLVDAVIVLAAASLSAAGFRHPATVATAIGGAVLVIAGPLVNGYLRRLMMNPVVGHQVNQPPAAGGAS